MRKSVLLTTPCFVLILFMLVHASCTFHRAGLPGAEFPPVVRIRSGTPPDAGMRPELFRQIDSLAIEGIRQGAYPGCQVVVVRDGIMIYNKAFGHHTYDSMAIVTTGDIYDLASVTKIAATTASLMRLADMGMIDPGASLATYMPRLEGSNMGAIRLAELLTHQAGFIPWIPFHRASMQHGEYLPGIYSKHPTEDHPVMVAGNLYIQTHYRDTILTQILQSDLGPTGKYVYSDLGFILLKELIEELTGEGLDAFLDHQLYGPLGLSNMGFRPLERFDPARLVPTEMDTLWRRQVVHGTVHDPVAAMLGGVSGHAGLFSNATDLATLMQVFLNGGSYGGRQYFHEHTVKEFTRRQDVAGNNRRALGFDKPAEDPDKGSPAARSASPLSFGHSGFTGTLAWADPAENLVFVFLSNRTYPDQSNRTLIEQNIRTNIHQLLYDAIIDK